MFGHGCLMPDVQVVLAFLKHVEAAGSPSSSLTASKPDSTAHAVLSESPYRLVWLYHACFVSVTTSGIAEERLGKFDVGGLVASLSMLSDEESENSDEDPRGDETGGLRTIFGKTGDWCL